MFGCLPFDYTTLAIEQSFNATMPKSNSDYAETLKALSSKLNNSNISAKRKSPTKKTIAVADLCSAAVTSTKGKAKGHLESGNDKRPIYMMTENDGKKHTFYLQCSRAHKDGSKFCGTHKKTYDEDKTRIINYKRMIAMKNVVEVALEDDIFSEKKSTKKSTNPKRKTTVSAADVTERLDKLEAIMLGLTKAVSDGGSIKSTASVAETVEAESDDDDAVEAESDDNDAVEAESDDDDAAEAESDDDDDAAEAGTDDDAAEADDVAEAESDAEAESGDDDEVDATEITTNDGQTFGLVESSMAVYSPDGEEQGKLVEVDDDEACVTFNDTQYIIAKDITFKGDTYFQCVITNKAYHADDDGDIKHCGKVVKTVSGKFKVKLDS